MKRWILAFAVLASFVGIGTLSASRGFAQSTPEKLRPKELKVLFEGLGHEVKQTNTKEGEEKYELTIKTDKLNIPVAFELSGSKRYIWMTVFLGAYKDAISAKALLERNTEIQPCQFYITSKGNLCAALAIENRGVSPAIAKFNLEKLVADVGKTQPSWTAPPTTH